MYEPFIQTTVWIRCVGVILWLIKRTKSLYVVTRCSILESTDTVAIHSCRPFRAPHWRYAIILNSAMNFYLISNMCASVHADFCRPKGLESAQTRPSTYSGSIEYIKYIHIGSNIMTIDRPRRQCSRSSIRQSPWSVKYYFQCGKTIYRRCHIGAYIYPDYRSALQAVFSVIYMSVIVVSQHESSE